MPRPGSHVLHPSLAGAVQAVDEAAMPDAGVLTRAGTGEPVFDPGTGVEVAVAVTTVWEGPCRVEADPTRDRVQMVGGEPVTLRTYDVALPVRVDQVVHGGVVGVHVDDIWTVTASASAFLVDRPLRVVDLTADTVEGERHLVCEDILG